jgi:hypothetical protein
MAWLGLTAESKEFCGYNEKSLAGKAMWWLIYITDAEPKFWWYTLRDKVRFSYVRWKHSE